MELREGAAGVCLNENNELLMVLQGKEDEKKTWSVPTGGKEDGETFASCCLREVWEETGYRAETIEELMVKQAEIEEIPIQVEVHYYAVKIIGGAPTICDPDHLIHEIAWKSREELKALKLSYPEDREFLLRVMS
ncbi:RNA pyrophosphohydrolase [Oceanobacillus picturae]|jgi:8-oxo-dGTP diphosphatase|uniref:RNA pyrophosphohydrolase n=1 Tax=Oceanobacillus picturae TaxID=171693 RepID=W9B8I9_9BACI|nr:NUDIX hydrolase [Oceanobacillus picturae]CDO02885.1 RNA pyrophosphohydrolase [Oceanobacillus picturae]